MLNVELCYVQYLLPPVHLHLTLAEGSTVLDALLKSGIFDNYPETRNYKVGVFSKIVDYEHLLKDGNRIEIYRELLMDPKEKRRIMGRAKITYTNNP